MLRKSFGLGDEQATLERPSHGLPHRQLSLTALIWPTASAAMQGGSTRSNVVLAQMLATLEAVTPRPSAHRLALDSDHMFISPSTA